MTSAVPTPALARTAPRSLEAAAPGGGLCPVFARLRRAGELAGTIGGDAMGWVMTGRADGAHHEGAALGLLGSLGAGLLPVGFPSSALCGDALEEDGGGLVVGILWHELPAEGFGEDGGVEVVQAAVKGV